MQHRPSVHDETGTGIRSRALRVALVLLAALALVLPFAPPLASPAHAADVQPARVDGATRLETAANVAEASFPEGSTQALIAPSTDFPEALAGAALAGALDAPVLLNPPAELADTTRTALQDLGVEAVSLLGDTDDLSEAVEQELSAHYTVARIEGADDYETAAMIARTAVGIAGDLPDPAGRTSVLVASGQDFPDALTASGPAFDAAIPLLLTMSDVLPESTRAAIADLAPEQALVVGGIEAVSTEVAEEIEALGVDVVRLDGRNRVETATSVASWFVHEAGYFTRSAALLARGDDFPDALTAASLSGRLEAPILLAAQPDLLTETTSAWLRDACPTLALLQVVGGTDAVTVEVANGAEAAAESCEEPADPGTGQTFAVAPMQPLTADPGEALDFSVTRRYDEEPFTGPVDIVLFPCENAEITGAAPDRFADADGDGAADGFASTDTGQARIATVNGEDIPDQAVVGAVGPDDDGTLDLRLASQAEDCTVVVVVNGDDDGEFDVDADGHPVEPYGVGRASWTA